LNLENRKDKKMIKKIFVGVLLAGVFGLLILGAINRTLAKSDKLEPLALSEGSGRGNGGNKSTGSNGFGQGESASGDDLGVGRENVESWADPITVTVDEVSSDLWIVSNNDGFVLEIEGRSLSYMVDNGFKVVPGDELILSGFYEDDSFEIGVITNNTTQQTLTLRESTGRPLWAGGGRRNTLP